MAPADEQRYPTTWPGRARLEGARDWMDCVVVEMSTATATVDLHCEPEEDVLRRVLHVHVASGVGGRDDLHLTGEVVYQLMPRGGETRVGIRFLRQGLLPEELLELLFRLRNR